MSELAPSTPAEESSFEGPGPEVALLFIGVALSLGALCRQLLGNTRIPYTVALLLIGIALGSWEHETPHLGLFGTSLRMWANINPNLILYVFLPALLFESSFAFEYHQIKRCIVQMFLLAGPGVVLSTALLGIVDYYILPYGWSWPTSMLLGGLLSATDPVAVVALLRDLGASKKLSTIIDGEALMNDGSAIVVFQLFVRIVIGQNFTAGDIVSFLFKASLGAVALGLAFGLVSFGWLSWVFSDYVIEVTITFTASYMVFFVANDVTGMSGVLATMTLGMFLAVYAKALFVGESEHSMHHFWELISFMANTLIFILSGVIIAETILRSSNIIRARDWGYLVVLYLFVQLSRAVVVLILFPGLKLTGYGLNWKEGVVLVWSGLRGAVALSLALIVNRIGEGTSVQAQNERKHISTVTQARIMFLTGGVVFLTLIVNGSTTQFLLSFLKMTKTSETKKRVLEFTQHEMYDRALQAFQEVGEDEELGSADWTTVQNYVSVLKLALPPEERQNLHPHRTDTAGDLHQQNLQDTRFRFFSGVQAAYWAMLEEGRVSQQAALLLMQSVEEAIDLTALEGVMDDWRGVAPHVKLPGYLKAILAFLGGAVPESVLSWLTVDRLELAAAMAAAYLRAHRLARQQLRDFLGESVVADTVITESEALEQFPRKFLDDVRLVFPQVLRIVKTKQVTYAILSVLRNYVESLSGAGLLDQRESLHLHDVVQADLKTLMRSPPAVTMPTREQHLRAQPLVGALPPSFQKILIQGAKEYHKLHGSALYHEGEEARGIWLVVSGIVKWESTFSEGSTVESSRLTHGTTVGLHECLTGQLRASSVIADTVLHCFFVEKSRILSAMRSDPDMADFLWQESALQVSKLVLPHLFSTYPVAQLRAIFLAAAHLTTLPKGSALSVAPHEVAILLDGAVLLDGRPNNPLVAPRGFSPPPPLAAAKGSRGNVLGSTVLHLIASREIRVLMVNLHDRAWSIPSRQLTPSASGVDLRLGSPGSLMRSGSSHMGALGGPGASGSSQSLTHHHLGLMRWNSSSHRPSSELKALDDAEGGGAGGNALKGGDLEMTPLSGSAHDLVRNAVEVGFFGSQVHLRRTSNSRHSPAQVLPSSIRHLASATRSSSHPEVLQRGESVRSLSGGGGAGSQSRVPLQGGARLPPLQRAANSHGDLPQPRALKHLSWARETLGENRGGSDSEHEDEHVERIDSPSHLFGSARS